MYSVTPFVGRDKELKEIRRHFDEAINYNGSFVLIRGETGVGKTRLLEEFIGSIEPTVWILTGKALQDDVRPFSPFLQIIEAQLEKIEYHPQWLVKLIEPEIFPCLAHFLPKLKNRYPIEIPTLGPQYEDKSVFFNAVERFLSTLVLYKPLVLFVDDIIWMDADAQDLFKYVVMRMADKAILFLGSARPWQKDSNFQLLVDVLAERRIIHICNLQNLDEIETETLLVKQFGTIVSSGFADWLFHVTKGNPLFISEVLDVIQYRNILYYQNDEEQWKIRDDYADFPISPTIESIVKLRLRNLSSIEKSVLQKGAMIGESFSFAMVHQLSSRAEKAKILNTLHRLKAQRLLTEKINTWQFSHPLIRELLYKGIEKSKRKKIHRKVGFILKKDPDAQLEEIAHHLIVDLSPDEETPEFCRYLLQIGKKILLRYNEQLGWRCLVCAQNIAERFPERLRNEGLSIKAELSRLRWVLGKDIPTPKDIQDLIEQLKSVGLKEEAVMLYRILIYRAIDGLKIDSAREFLKQGLAIADKTTEDFWTLRVEDATLKGRAGKFQEAEEMTKKLIEEIDPEIAPGSLWKAVYNLGMFALSKGELRAAYEFVSKALKIAERYNLTPVRATSYANCGFIETMLGQLDPALLKLREVVKDAELSQRVQKIAAYEILLGRCLLTRGEFDNALKYFDDAHKKAEGIGFKRAIAAAYMGRADVLLETERIDDALNEINAIQTEGLDEEWLCDFHLLKSRVWFEKEDLKQAEKELADASILAEKLKLKIQIADAKGQRAMIYLKNKKKLAAMHLLDEARAILSEKGALPDLASLLTRFGFILGKEEGDCMFTKGLEILFQMGALPRIENLLYKIDGCGFKKAKIFVEEKMHRFVSKKERLEITTFGGLSVRRYAEVSNIKLSEWQSRKARELLALIICFTEGKRATRETLASYLWPELEAEKSQNNLRVTLARLNQTLKIDCVQQDGQTLFLDKGRVFIDVWEFENILKEWQNLRHQGKLHTAEKKAQEAIALYRGDFLPEFYNPAIEDKQRELKQKVRELLLWLADRSKERLDWHEAISFAHKLIAIDPNDEGGHRVIMESLWQQGDKVGAIRQFERFKKNLEKELDITPTSETLELYNKIVKTV